MPTGVLKNIPRGARFIILFKKKMKANLNFSLIITTYTAFVSIISSLKKQEVKYEYNKYYFNIIKHLHV